MSFALHKDQGWLMKSMILTIVAIATALSFQNCAPTKVPGGESLVADQSSSSADTTPVVTQTGAPISGTFAIAIPPLSIDPKNATVRSGGTIAVGVTGGSLPYRYSVATPNSGTFAGNVFSASSAYTGSAIVNISDSGTFSNSFAIQVTAGTVAANQGVPVTFDVSASGSCGNGFCACVAPNGTADPVSALAICKAKGFDNLQSFTTAAGTLFSLHCDPNGGCFTNLFAGNLKCQSVTCRSALPAVKLAPAPVSLNVMTSPGCQGQLCSCGLPGGIATPDPAAALQICKVRGLTTLVSYTTANGPIGTYQCNAFGQNCFANTIASNLVCSSVVCQ